MCVFAISSTACLPSCDYRLAKIGAYLKLDLFCFHDARLSLIHCLWVCAPECGRRGEEEKTARRFWFRFQSLSPFDLHGLEVMLGAVRWPCTWGFDHQSIMIECAYSRTACCFPFTLATLLCGQECLSGCSVRDSSRWSALSFYYWSFRVNIHPEHVHVQWSAFNNFARFMFSMMLLEDGGY